MNSAGRGVRHSWVIVAPCPQDPVDNPGFTTVCCLPVPADRDGPKWNSYHDVACRFRSPEDPFGPFPVRGSDSDRGTGRAVPPTRHAGSGGNGHREPVRCARVLLRGGGCRHPADHRLPAGRLPQRPAGAERSQTGAGPASPPGPERDRLPQPASAGQPGLSGRRTRRGRGAGADGLRTLQRGPHSAHRRATGGGRPLPSRATGRMGGGHAADPCPAVSRAALRRDSTARPARGRGDRGAAGRPRLQARAAAGRHQRGLFHRGRDLRGARRAAVHSRGCLRGPGRAPAFDARALLQVGRGDAPAIRRPARGGGQHAGRSPPSCPPSRPARDAARPRNCAPRPGPASRSVWRLRPAPPASTRPPARPRKKATAIGWTTSSA